MHPPDISISISAKQQGRQASNAQQSRNHAVGSNAGTLDSPDMQHSKHASVEKEARHSTAQRSVASKQAADRPKAAKQRRASAHTPFTAKPNATANISISHQPSDSKCLYVAIGGPPCMHCWVSLCEFSMQSAFAVRALRMPLSTCTAVLQFLRSLLCYVTIAGGRVSGHY